MAGGNDSLDIDTVRLRRVCDLLQSTISPNVDSTINMVSGSVNRIDQSWKDGGGAAYLSGYQQFSSDCSNISGKIKTVGQYGSQMADDFEKTEESYANAIEE